MNSRTLWLRGLVTSALVCAALAGPLEEARAQNPPATVTRTLGKDRYEVRIGAAMYTAFPDSALERMLLEKASTDSLRARLAAAETLIAQYAHANEGCKVLQTTARTYVTTLEEQVADYDKLVDNYRKLLRGAAPKLSLVGGIGATGKDTKPAVMVGVEIARLRIYGFGQESNAGVMAGGSIRVF